MASLLKEMTDREAVTRYPNPPYRCLQASSYNRASVRRGGPGWFADSDGTGFIRKEKIDGKTEWVVMEHLGPGCITRIWAPSFYFGRKPQHIRIYLDGSGQPVLDEPLIDLLTGKGPVKYPFAARTTRAGVFYLPIPFAGSCKVTMTSKPFYYSINYRAYPKGVRVETFSLEKLRSAKSDLREAAARLVSPEPVEALETKTLRFTLEGRKAKTLTLPSGPSAVSELVIRLDPCVGPFLRSVVMEAEFDGERTIWCPIGDFFCSADSLHPFETWDRKVSKEGVMTCRWLMPYEKSGAIRFKNLAGGIVSLQVRVSTVPYHWDDLSLHFHAGWRPDDFVRGNKIADWNFVDIEGKGVFVGDAWTVLNPTDGWWGEGDEKIYVDGAWEKGFPTHFGTGTEDYYGWAGGKVPTRADEFDEPFVANVRVGGLGKGRTRGFNICTRSRSLDAIPFEKRLRFDMEASPGTGQRRKSDVLGYSAVTFWYARPGSKSNRGPAVEAASKPIMSLGEIEKLAKKGVPRGMNRIEGALEFEELEPSRLSPGLAVHPQRPAECFHPAKWSNSKHLFIEAKKPGDFLEFTFSEQFHPATLKVYVTKSYDFGVMRILVNGKTAVDRLDLFSEKPGVEAVSLGRWKPVEGKFIIRFELVGPNPRSRGKRTWMGLDCIVIRPR